MVISDFKITGPTSYSGVAEPGGPGGHGPPPPKNLSGRARVSFGPPKF